MGAFAGPVIGAGIGAFSSSSSAKKASKAQEKAADDIRKAAAEARSDALVFFPQAKQELLTGAQGAFDVFGRAIPLQQQQLTAGNLAAQQSAAQGFDQAQAAILGMPTQQFQTSAVPFDDQPFLGGQSLFGTPLNLFPGGSDKGSLPTFAGLGGSFANPWEYLDRELTDQQIADEAFDFTKQPTLPPINTQGVGGLGTPIPNPNNTLFTPGRRDTHSRDVLNKILATSEYLKNNPPVIPEGFVNPPGAENVLGLTGKGY